MCFEFEIVYISVIHPCTPSALLFEPGELPFDCFFLASGQSRALIQPQKKNRGEFPDVDHTHKVFPKTTYHLFE